LTWAEFANTFRETTGFPESVSRLGPDSETPVIGTAAEMAPTAGRVFGEKICLVVSLPKVYSHSQLGAN
jgi:hypothetical protein